MQPATQETKQPHKPKTHCSNQLMSRLATSNDLPTPPKTLVTVKQLAEMIPAYEGRTGGIRWQIFNEETNGLKESGAILRYGPRKLLIDVDKYFAWAEKHANSQLMEAQQ